MKLLSDIFQHSCCSRTLVCKCITKRLCPCVQVAKLDVQQLEETVDALLCCDIAAIDPCSLCTNSYLQLMQPLQLTLEYAWHLYSRDSRQQAVTATCLTAANAFCGALKRYCTAAQSELLSPQECQSQLRSEVLRTQLKPLKKLHDSTKARLKVCHHSLC